MAKLIITVEGGKITQTLNFLDRNVKDNRYVYGNGHESGIVENPAEVYEDIPDNYRITENYEEILDAVNLGRVQLTNSMRKLNELEKEMDAYVIPLPEREKEHVIALNSNDLKVLAKIQNDSPFKSDKEIEEAVKKLIHGSK